MTMLKRTLLLGLFTALLGVIASAIPQIDDLESRLGLQWLFLLRGPRPAPAEVVVISINQDSFRYYNLPIKSSLWPRSYHAELIDKLHREGARVIVFDLILDEARGISEDGPFAKAIEQAGNVVLFQNLRREVVPLKSEDGVSAMIQQVVSPIPELAEAAAALAPFPLPKAPAKVSQVWTFKRGAGDIPTIPVAAFQLFVLPYYDEFKALLNEIRSQRSTAASASLHEIVDFHNDATQLARQLRQFFQANAFHEASLVAQLEALQDEYVRSLCRSLIKLYSGHHSWFLDYYGPAKGITTLPYHQVINEEISFDFKDKAVFVGFSDQLDPKDGFYTVYSDLEGLGMSGVEIVATSFANLLEGRNIQPVDSLHHLLIISLWGMIIGALFMLLPGSYTVVLAMILFGGAVSMAYYWFSQHGIWLPLMTPLLGQLPFALIVSSVWRYRIVRGERQSIQDALGHYLPIEVIDDWILRGGRLPTTGRVVNSICLSTDAEQYSALSEQYQPAQLRSLLNQYYELLFEPVNRHGGFVSDVVGDSMLALWTRVSSSDPRQREQACLAALEIFSNVCQSNQEPSAVCLPTRIGLHSGEIVLGNVGADGRFEYRAVGDSVNTVTRIEALNKYLGTWLLASFQVVESLDSIITRELGSFLLVGKTRPLIIHELVCLEEGLTSQRCRFHEAFEQALRTFQAERWQEAAVCFGDILSHYGYDGPSSFYLDLCHQYTKKPPPESWKGVVVLSHK